MYSSIIGTGSYLPKKVLTNRDLEKTLDTSDEWIVKRTGISERRIAADDEAASDLALFASQDAMAAAGVNTADVDLIIVATTTPDYVFPSTACILQSKLGITAGAAFDVQAVCSGFVYALSCADKFVASGQCGCALVVGSEVYSRILDWNDRATCVLFGDGAGAIVLTPNDAPGILSTHLHADGRYSELLAVPGNVCKGEIKGSAFLTMEGAGVFKFAIKAFAQLTKEALSANNMSIGDIDWLIPHQANSRIIEATANKIGLSMDKVIVTLDKHANTSAASIPLALDAGIKDGRIRPGHRVLMEAVGGGFTWGACLAVL
ncbi:MAG: beta-ketoacyl-ACP synthase III [Burkholderiales bacterium]